MKEQRQRVSNKNTGDCFRACICSILEIENSDDFVKIQKENWTMPYRKKFQEIGLRLNWDMEAIWRQGYWIASVPSLNYKNTSHSIVMFDSKVCFDPSTKKRYRKGRNLLGNKLVSDGWWIEIDDMGKLKKFLNKEMKKTQ